MVTHTSSDRLNKKLKLGMVINILFTLFEFSVGIFSGSLALISDAFYNLTDVLSIIITFTGNKLGQRKPTSAKTYGYGRASIITALLNGIMLILLGFCILYQAYQRFNNPEPVEGGIVMLIGFLGILTNGGVALLFLKDKDDINVHSTLLNMFFDALASAAALVAGFVIKYTGYTPIDSIASGFTGILLLISASYIIKKVLHILLQGVPHTIDITVLSGYLESLPGVKHVSNVHVWSLTSRDIVFSCHLIVDMKNSEDTKKLVADIKKYLKENFGISHATVEVEYRENIH
jgi:cobalt-zinc-cadmium efflux system protein